MPPQKKESMENGEEELFEDMEEDFNQYINNQNKSEDKANIINPSDLPKKEENNINDKIDEPELGKDDNNNLHTIKLSNHNDIIGDDIPNNNIENVEEEKEDLKNQESKKSESGEIDLGKLNLDDSEPKHSHNEPEPEQKNNDDEVDKIEEELFIEEYNPSLGLINIDNPKYLNALIQCFAHIPIITDKIINLHLDPNFDKILPNLELSNAYRKLLINIFLPEKVYNMNKQSYNSSKFRDSFLFIKDDNIEIKGFIDYLIRKMHDELNTKKNINQNNDINENLNKNIQMKEESDVLTEFLDDFTKKNNSIISKALYGLSKIHFYCNQCQNSFYNYQCYSYLYFDLNVVLHYKQNKYNRDDVSLTLLDCLDYYQKTETLLGDKGLFCPSCKQQTESTSKRSIYSTKNIIIFILDRKNLSEFKENQFELKEKINLADYTQYRKGGQKPKEKFFLGGVVNYSLDNYGNEKYVAYCKVQKNNDWYCYDDENVYSVDFNDIVNNGYPLVLFYHKLIK